MNVGILLSKHNKIILILAIVLIALGVFFRFYDINKNDFVFYDEGMWLNLGNELLVRMDEAKTNSFTDFFAAVKLIFRISLSTAKSFWAFLSLSRGLILSADSYYFSRIISAVCGSLTILLVFVFARKFYGSFFVALLSAVIIALYPSHIFYSRLALQESLSTLLFLIAIHSYINGTKISYKTILSGVLLSLVYFSNYRMIVSPFFILFCEIYLSVSERRKINWLKAFCCIGVFAILVFFVSSLYGWANGKITFAWMFHQNELSEKGRSAMNIFSYPYYLFRLDGIFFGVLFISGLFPLFRRNLRQLMPFVFACAAMLLFSFPQEKGVRYICFAMPFIAMSISYTLERFIEDKYFKKQSFLIFTVLLLGVIAEGSFKGFNNTFYHNDYRQSVDLVKGRDPSAKIVSTQFMVQKLYVKNKKDIVEAPDSFEKLLSLYSAGYRYLIIDPQAFVSLSADKKRFSGKLVSYMDFAIGQVKPIYIFSHMSKGLFERFVLEHNESLPISLQFLEKSKGGRNRYLYLYDIGSIMIKMYEISSGKSEKNT
ncbi:MAG: phospholipid carrier-dependent glycosyltransferase [Candidatus Omnitrophica bacterium]|nr:phospholipid carrier-dependent glycosyltransferase [Candidatus Omnitrophota bacterium]